MDQGIERTLGAGAALARPAPARAAGGFARLLLIGSAIFCAVILAAAAAVLLSMRDIQREAHHLTIAIGWIEASRHTDVAMTAAVGDLQAFLLEGDPRELDQAERHLADASLNMDVLASIERDPSFNEHGGGGALAQQAAQRLAIRNELRRSLAALREVQIMGEEQRQQIFAELERTEDLLVDLLAKQEALREANTGEATEAIAAAYGRALFTVLAVTTFIVVILVGFFVAIRARIVQPLQELALASDDLGAGRAPRPIAGDGLAEIGALQRSFSHTAATLREREAALSEQVALAEQARQVAERAERTSREQLATISLQQATIREMSVPVLPIGDDTLVMPLVGALDHERLAQMQAQALERISRDRARTLLLDVTGVPIIDSQVAQGLLTVVQAAGLLGARVALVGIRPEVAQTIVGLGLRLDGVHTYATLRDGLRAALGG